jgi:hypothetical protein
LGFKLVFVTGGDDGCSLGRVNDYGRCHANDDVGDHMLRYAYALLHCYDISLFLNIRPSLNTALGLHILSFILIWLVHHSSLSFCTLAYPHSSHLQYQT